MDNAATATTANGRQGPAIPELAAAALVAAAFGWAYAPNFADLAWTWEHVASYSHGFLIIPIALYILWQRRDRLDRGRLAPKPWAWGLVLGVFAVRAWLYERNDVWAENATMIPAVAALALAFGGWRLLGWAAPSIAYLVFMLPLPPSVNTILAYPLQRLATMGSGALLQAGGLPVLVEANTIFVGVHPLEVAQACNGLSMLQTFVALIVAVAILADRPRWEKGALLASVVPIALASNILRIAATAWCYHAFGPEAKAFGWTVEQLGHDAAGWAMMPIALLMVWAELKLLGWLFVEEEERERPVFLNPLAPMPSGGVPPKKAAPKDGPRPPLPRLPGLGQG